MPLRKIRLNVRLSSSRSNDKNHQMHVDVGNGKKKNAPMEAFLVFIKKVTINILKNDFN